VREGEFLCETFAVQLRQEMAQAWLNLVTAVGQQDKQRGGSAAPRQVMEEFQAGLITPMNIFNDEQHWLFGGLTCKELRQRGKEAAFLLFGIRCGQWSQVGRYGHDIG
jgi:hypothetical protein